MNRTTRNKMIQVMVALSTLIVGAAAHADVDAAEIYCTIRDTGNHLNCQWVGKDQRRSMTPEETAEFIDKAEIAAYVSVRSRKGMERVFLVDPESPQFRKLGEVIKTGSLTEIAKAKLDVFADIEKRVVKISDDLDAASTTMELVKYDDSVAVDKYKRELRRVDNELVTLKGGSNSNENKSYDEGPTAVGDSTLSGVYGAKYSYQLGFGFASGSLVATPSTTGSVTASTTVANLNFDWRSNLDWNWLTYSEIEARFGLPTQVYLKGQTTASTPMPYNATWKNAKCWGTGAWCFEIDIADYNYVGLGSNKAVYPDVYSDTFFGGSFVYRQSIRNGVVIYRVGYLAGSAANQMEGKTIANESMLVATANYERQVYRNHGVGAQLGIEQISASTATTVATSTATQALTNTNVLANVFYKYSF